MMPSVNKQSWVINAVDLACISLCQTLLLLSIGLVAQAQPDPAVALDRMFRSESSFSSSSSQGQSIDSLKNWLGAYQRIRTDGNNFIAVFDRGSLPIDAKFKANGSVESLSFGCPISKSLSINDAPEGLKKALSKCAGFKS